MVGLYGDEVIQVVNYFYCNSVHINKYYWQAKGVDMRKCISGVMMVSMILCGYGGGDGAGAQAGSASMVLTSVQGGAGIIDVSLLNEAHAAQNRGLDWLAARQRPDGSWSNPDFPALTALSLWAFARSEHPARAQVVSNAVKFLRTCVQSDGGIYRKIAGKGGGLSNYNTAICMVALHLTGDRSLAEIVLNARKFVAASQHLEGDDMYRGGMGYDKATGRAYSDLSDSVIAYEAMRLTQSAEDLRPAGGKKADLDWQAATQFLARVQNKTESGPDNAGGFIYRPDESKAGATTNDAGALVLRSFGSMTYAGMLSLIYADVSKEDPRVQSAFAWAMKHWTLDENPGMGVQGLFYFYNIMAKCLATYGAEKVPAAGHATPISWRVAMVQKLVGLQLFEKDGSGQGYWVNDNNRFWENDQVLVTAYSLIALDVVLGESK